ncbi:hypothetical protein A8709_28335 [Paenibacillus pectinilyticus]|uniref:DUF2663 domain-containing protein n=1 Tax=Paenibacillus pectinilyticus TaxID=512399 RepID=A0A1C0ZUJ8_9BACL|nr:DUF2663 family protein [Paenibacillus pectinilyticus]OCT11782.1 hypothetical protein A8709_28335 [Paenibacillus pectinilyticus]
MFGPNINVSEDTEVMLRELQDRKKKWDKLKMRQPYLSIVTAAILLGVIYMLYRDVLVRSGGNALVILDLLISNKLLCGMLLAGISLFMYTSNRAGETEKAKGKYEDLRIEAVERLEASWLKDVKSEARDQISSFLSNLDDINIRYKN